MRNFFERARVCFSDFLNRKQQLKLHNYKPTLPRTLTTTTTTKEKSSHRVQNPVVMNWFNILRETSGWSLFYFQRKRVRQFFLEERANHNEESEENPHRHHMPSLPRPNKRTRQSPRQNSTHRPPKKTTHLVHPQERQPSRRPHRALLVQPIRILLRFPRFASGPVELQHPVEVANPVANVVLVSSVNEDGDLFR